MNDVGDQHPVPAREKPAEHSPIARPSPDARPRGFTILQKIVGIIVALVVLLVGALAVYFPARQVGEFRAALATKATTYGKFLAKQLGPVVAFEDRQTAREVFEAVAEDHDVVAVGIYLQGGTPLESRGALAPGTLAMLEMAVPPHLTMTDQRVLVIEPVLSLEGPRGTLVLELSTRSVELASQKAMWTGLFVGGCGLFVGSMAAWLIGRSFARRLRTIADVAAAVAGGNLDTQPIADAGRDEIGSMADAFNVMLAQLRGLIGQIKRNAKDEQERLEELVSLRTRELDHRNADMRLLLDNAEQGFLTIGRDGIMSRERSAAVERWLSPLPPGMSFGACIERFVPKFAANFAAGFSQVIADELPLELTLHQLPSSFAVGGRSFSVRYKPILWESSPLDKLLVVISDVTAAIAREHAEQDEREVTRLFRHALEDMGGLIEFVNDTGRLVDQIAGSAAVEPILLRRLVHTLKGNAATFGVHTVAALCHEMETAFDLEGVRVSAEDKNRLRSRWGVLCGKLRAIAPDGARNLQVEPSEHEAMIAMIDAGASRQEIRETLQSWKLEAIGLRFKRISMQIETLAERLGKAPVDVRIESNRLRLPHEHFLHFWPAFAHVIRNAVDHGVVSPEDRARSGKPKVAVIRLYAGLTDTGLVIEVEDFGNGINWEEVRKVAQELRLPCDTREDLAEALFADGMSTRAEATDVSGRGVGLGALREACRNAGGEVEVSSEQGVGTLFRFIWPGSVLGVVEQPSGTSGYVWIGKGQHVDADAS